MRPRFWLSFLNEEEKSRHSLAPWSLTIKPGWFFFFFYLERWIFYKKLFGSSCEGTNTILRTIYYTRSCSLTSPTFARVCVIPGIAIDIAVDPPRLDQQTDLHWQSTCFVVVFLLSSSFVRFASQTSQLAIPFFFILYNAHQSPVRLSFHLWCITVYPVICARLLFLYIKRGDLERLVWLFPANFYHCDIYLKLFANFLSQDFAMST